MWLGSYLLHWIDWLWALICASCERAILLNRTRGVFLTRYLEHARGNKWVSAVAGKQSGESCITWIYITGWTLRCSIFSVKRQAWIIFFVSSGENTEKWNLSNGFFVYYHMIWNWRARLGPVLPVAFKLILLDTESYPQLRRCPSKR